MYLPKLRLSLLVLATGATLAWACGPEFYSILQDRKASLVREFSGDFFFAARRLQPAPAKPFPQDSPEPASSNADAKPKNPEYVGLNAAQIASVQAMRAATDGDAAFALGASLPPAVRAYTAGAVDYQRAKNGADDETDEPMPAMDAIRALAAKRFEAVLHMKAEDATLRSVWAAYSLGLTYGLIGGEDSLARTDKYYALTRELAAKGAPDPQFLASDSFGMQALEHLNAGHISRAVELYAEQASHNSTSGIRSLAMVSQKLLNDPELLQEHIQSPVVQQTLLAYVLAYGDDTYAVDAGLPATDSVRGAGKTSRFQTFTHALEAAGITSFANTDKLAAAAYRFGNYDAATRYVGTASTPLAHWLRGKLAVRTGKLQEAAGHFAKALHASRSLGPEKDGLRATDRARLVAENATLQLSRGDFVQALDQMYQVGGRYWLDLAYLAERVLTVEELQAYVDQHVPAVAPPSKTEMEQRALVSDKDVQWPAFHVSGQLRDLLARRLMREGRFDAALPYFAKKEARSDAVDYASALRAADRAWTSVGRARSLFEAAQLARFKGMEIMGYELAPDYFVTDGNYEAGTPEPTRGGLATKAELQRYQASAAPPEQRFHYRYVATALAQRAAEALPHQSAAYAQVLDNATSWLIDRDPAAATKIYLKYLANGPLRIDDKPFGRNPVSPNFWRAYGVQARLLAHDARLWARHHKPLAWSLIALAGAGLVAAAWLLRRRIKRNAEAEIDRAAAA